MSNNLFAKLLIVVLTLVSTLFVTPIRTNIYADDSVAMYRVYNPNSGEHFYTANTSEKSNLVNLGWKDEGIGWYAPTTGNAVYRLYNANGGEHHYTLSATEKDSLVRVGWKYEGIGWYSATDTSNAVSIYREYNPNAFANNHNYTASKSENDWLVSLGWKAEGIGWYGTTHEHSWVYHEATGHNEQVLVKAAYDETTQVQSGQKLVVDSPDMDVCDYVNDDGTTCGQSFTSESNGIDAHQWSAHNGFGSWHTVFGKQHYESVYETKMVHHDAIYETKWLTDTVAYYSCSCGATKAA